MERNKGCAGPLLGARHAFIKVESNQLNCLHSNERVMKMRVFLIAVTMLIVSACGGGGGGSSSQQVPVSQGGSSGGSGGSGSSGGGSSNNGPEWVEGEFGDWTQDYIAQCENPRSSSEYDDTQGSTALEKFWIRAIKNLNAGELLWMEYGLKYWTEINDVRDPTCPVCHCSLLLNK